jgi:hypothetical protein
MRNTLGDVWCGKSLRNVVNEEKLWRKASKQKEIKNITKTDKVI